MLAGREVAAIESLLCLLRNGDSEGARYFTFWSTEGGHSYLFEEALWFSLQVGRAWRDLQD